MYRKELQYLTFYTIDTQRLDLEIFVFQTAQMIIITQLICGDNLFVRDDNLSGLADELA